jgi:hypothetical protein
MECGALRIAVVSGEPGAVLGLQRALRQHAAAHMYMWGLPLGVSKS